MDGFNGFVVQNGFQILTVIFCAGILWRGQQEIEKRLDRMSEEIRDRHRENTTRIEHIERRLDEMAG